MDDQHTTGLRSRFQVDAPTPSAVLDGVVVPFRQHTNPTRLDGPAPTQTAQQIPGLALWPVRRGDVRQEQRRPRRHRLPRHRRPVRHHHRRATPTSLVTWLDNYKSGPHPIEEPTGTVTCIDRQALASADLDAPVDLDDVRFRMLKIEELRSVMAYPSTYRFAGPDDVEPSNRDKVRLLGDGVTPPVLTWLTNRTLDVLDEAS